MIQEKKEETKEGGDGNAGTLLGSSANALINETTSFDQKNSTQQTSQPVLHTFKADIQHLIKKNKLSIMKVASIESDAPRVEQSKKSSKSPSFAIFALSALAVVAIGLVLFAGFYSIEKQVPVNKGAVLQAGLFFTESRQQIDITDAPPRVIREAFASVRKKGVFSLGSLVEIIPITHKITRDGSIVYSIPNAKQLMQAFGARVPQLFLDTLNTEYLAGLHVASGHVPFLVLTTNAYDHSFAGMIAWEPFMEEDLAPFMSPNATYLRPATASGNRFFDALARNYDIRMLRGDDGTARLLYGFIGRRSLIITTDLTTFLMVAERMSVRGR